MERLCRAIGGHATVEPMNAPVAVSEQPYRAWLQVDAYLLLGESGALDGLGRTELIDGEVLRTNAQYIRHSYAKSLLFLSVTEALRRSERPLIALVEASVAMPPFDVPEPDIAVVAPPLYGKLLPLAAVALLVEVAETTQRYDLGRKAVVYARARVPEYWVVDLVAGEVVRHAEPDDSGYAAVDRVPFGAPVAARTMADVIIATADLLMLPER